MIQIKSPLRLGFAGGGTDLDYYVNKFGGLILNTTISLYTYVTIEYIDNQIILESIDQKKKFRFDKTLYLELNGELDLLKGVYNRFVKEFKLEPFTFKVTTFSEVPLGSGLGGSSTLVVSLVKAFSRFLNISLNKYEIVNLSFKVEREDIGIAGGLQDYYSAVFKGFNFIKFSTNKCVLINQLNLDENIIKTIENSIVLYYTGIQRNASIIEKNKTILLYENITLESMHKIKKDVQLMKNAIILGDINEMANILDTSWREKKRLNKNVSNTEIDKIYKLALENGAYGGKLSGAGGGGFMFFIVDIKKKKRLIDILNHEKGNVIEFSFVKGEK